MPCLNSQEICHNPLAQICFHRLSGRITRGGRTCFQRVRIRAVRHLRPRIVGVAISPSETAVSLLTLALWNTTITQFLWIGGLAAVPDITRGSYLFFLKPVIAAFLAVVFLSQNLTTPEVRPYSLSAPLYL